MATEKLSSRQKVLLNNIIQELGDIDHRSNLSGVSNEIGIRKLCRRLQEENIINLNQAFDLEVYMFGLLKLMKESK